MKTYLECFPCFINQALRAAEIATTDKGKIRRVVDEAGKMLQDISFEKPPPETGRLIYQKVHEITGNPDPYREIKAQSTKRALSLYPRMKSLVDGSKDRLLTAIRIAIAGNIIDFGPGPGVRGGEVVVSGSLKQLLESSESVTGAYLRGRRRIEIPRRRRSPSPPTAGRELRTGRPFPAARSRRRPDG